MAASASASASTKAKLKTKPVQSHIPPRPTPPLRPVPKGPIPSTLTVEEKAARYDHMLGYRKKKRSVKRQIAQLYREMENLEAEETKVLDQDLAARFGELDGTAEPCPVCSYERCICEPAG